MIAFFKAMILFFLILFLLPVVFFLLAGLFGNYFALTIDRRSWIATVDNRFIRNLVKKFLS